MLDARRLFSITMLNLALALSVPMAATAGETEYLFGLQDEEILLVMDHYVGKGAYDRADVLARMSAPFDCRLHGDLCAEIGAEYGYYWLGRVWDQARRGVEIERLNVEAEQLLDELSERYFDLQFPLGVDPRDPFFGVEYDLGTREDCTDRVVHADAGDFRLRQQSWAADALVLAVQWSKAKLLKRKNNGNYAGEKADHMIVEAFFFVTGPLGPEVLPRVKEKFNEKSVTATFPSGGFGISNHHTEGCGTVNGPAFLQACACTGPRPLIYQGL